MNDALAFMLLFFIVATMLFPESVGAGLARIEYKIKQGYTSVK